MVTADKDVISCELGGGAALLDLRSSTYYNVNAVGAFVWDQLQAPRKVAEIEDAVLARYEIDPETCRKDIYNLLKQLADAKLLEITDAAAS